MASTNGPYNPPTLTEVARLAGVGRGSASRALSGANYVSQEMHDRVYRAAARLGYVRNELARNLKMRRSHMVGIVIPDIGGSFMATCIRAAQSVLRDNHFMSVISFTNGNVKDEKREIDYLLSHQIDGLLVVPCYTKVSHFRNAYLKNIPIVAFDQPIRKLNFDAVLVKNREAARDLVVHLIQHNHQRIGCIGISGHLYSIHQRIEGYREAMAEAGLPEMISLANTANGSVAAQLEQWLTLESPPTAIFSLNDFTSIELLEAIAQHKIRVPEQIAVAGFDDVQMGGLLATPFTAMAQPAARLGAEAAALLVKRIEEPSSGRRKPLLLDLDFVIRRSCGCEDRQNVR